MRLPLTLACGVVFPYCLRRRDGRLARCAIMGVLLAAIVAFGAPSAVWAQSDDSGAQRPLPSPFSPQQPVPNSPQTPVPGEAPPLLDAPPRGDAPTTDGMSPADGGLPSSEAPLSEAPFPDGGLPTVTEAPPEDERPTAPPTWPIAVLQGLGKVTGRISTFEAQIDESVQFGTLNIVVRYCFKKPPEEPPESTAFIEIEEAKRGEPPVLRFRGWMFASSPALSALEHPVYDIWVVGCRKSSKSSSSRSR